MSQQRPPPAAPRVDVTPRQSSDYRDPVRTLGAVAEVAEVLEELYPTTTTTGPPVKAVNPVNVPPPSYSPTGVPAPISDRRCDGPIGTLFDQVFGPASPWAQSVAWRESNCRPDARNSEGASSLMQLMLPLHNDMYLAVGCDPVTEWADPVCAVNAAYRLFLGSGVQPWRL